MGHETRGRARLVSTFTQLTPHLNRQHSLTPTPPSRVNSFLNDVKRIAAEDYQPSDDDVVRARLRTMGVQEHRFVFEKGKDVHPSCHISIHRSRRLNMLL